jgi:nucleotide-binding universal stress UspA family protein
MSKTIILASHGTPGARAAEEAALEIAQNDKANIIHLYVVPDFWRGMRGDDWLNNAVTQKRFGDYLENELASEARIEINRLKENADRAGVLLETRAMFGKPAECLISVSEEESPYSIFIGTPRPRGEQGYNSRMKLEPLVQSLKARLVIVPRKP